MSFKDNFYRQFNKRFEQLDETSKINYLLRISQENKNFEKLLDSLNEGIIFIEPDYCIEYYNKKAQEIFGFPEACLGQFINKYIKEISWDIIDKFIDGKMESSRQELEIFYPSYRIILCFAIPEYDEFNNLTHISLLIEDITQTRQNLHKQKEQEKNHALSMLAAGVAHELGNPLNSMQINLQVCKNILKNKNSSNEKKSILSDSINDCLSDIQRLDLIIQDFLGAIKENKLNLESNNILIILKDALKSLKKDIENRGIKVVTTVEEETIPALFVDKTQINQVFYNIIKNAIQAMPENKELHIQINTYKDDYLCINFIDKGKGINAEQISKIFDPYFSNKTAGTGLGLFIVEKIIRSHGGFINIESKVEHGTNFKIHLPTSKKQFHIKNNTCN